VVFAPATDHHSSAPASSHTKATGLAITNTEKAVSTLVNPPLPEIQTATRTLTVCIKIGFGIKVALGMENDMGRGRCILRMGRSSLATGRMAMQTEKAQSTAAPASPNNPNGQTASNSAEMTSKASAL